MEPGPEKRNAALKMMFQHAVPKYGIFYSFILFPHGFKVLKETIMVKIS
jgi:hypothetical protein